MFGFICVYKMPMPLFFYCSLKSLRNLTPIINDAVETGQPRAVHLSSCLFHPGRMGKCAPLACQIRTGKANGSTMQVPFGVSLCDTAALQK